MNYEWSGSNGANKENMTLVATVNMKGRLRETKDSDEKRECACENERKCVRMRLRDEDIEREKE